MVMPPHHGLDEFDDEPLTENVFEFGGYTLGGLEIRVVEEATGRTCRIRVERETVEEISGRWREEGPPYPPGAVQFRSSMAVHFSPAVPGKEYRLVCSAGDAVRRYEGPPVPLDRSMPATAQERLRTRALVASAALAALAGAAWAFLG
jgi:hypothetical protein